MTILCDAAAIGYVIILLLCIYGTGLFTWGLKVAHRQGWDISAVYLYMLGLFVALGYKEVFSIISRHYTLYDPVMSYSFRQSMWWSTRAYPLIIVLAAIVAHMSHRAFCQKFK